MTLWQTGGEDSSGMYCASRHHDQPGWRQIGLRREEVEDGAGQSGQGRIHVEKICKKWVSVAVTFMMPEA